jgi:hypothetical protein
MLANEMLTRELLKPLAAMVSAYDEAKNSVDRREIGRKVINDLRAIFNSDVYKTAMHECLRATATPDEKRLTDHARCSGARLMGAREHDKNQTEDQRLSESLESAQHANSLSKAR